MAIRPQLLDVIGRITTPTLTEPTARVFIFDEWEGQPGFISVYVGRRGDNILLAHTTIASYTPSRRPRSEPYLVITTDGEQWTILKSGCGCGSPIRRLHTRQAIADHESYATSPGG